MNRWCFGAGLAALLAVVAGCGPSGPKMVEVTGAVKFDGKDVTEGDITFVPEDKTVGPEGGKITDGRYKLKVKEGKNRVRILATRGAPGKKGPMGEDFVEQYIPKQYNEETTLSADVTSGKTEHDFDLRK
jgi:hypothetical protein